MEGVAVAVLRWSLVGSVVGDAVSSSGIVIGITAGGRHYSNCMFWSWMEASSNSSLLGFVEEIVGGGRGSPVVVVVGAL